MNSMQNNGPDDKSFKAELGTLGQAYRQLKPEEPPELLNQAVLNSARRAVEKKAGWMDFGWIHGLTTAAVVVLALTIILTQQQPLRLEESGLLKKVEAESRRDLTRARPATSALEEDVLQADAPVEAMATEKAGATLVDEVTELRSGRAEINATVFADADNAADKPAAARFQLSAEETRLQEILALKRAGDDRWKAELNAFIESYPDYPLPDELKN